MELKDYERLPDLLSTVEISKLYNIVLELFKTKKIQKSKFLKIMCEITDRQVMTFELLEIGLRNEIDNLLCDIWNTDYYEDVDMILSIVVNLGLEKCFKKAQGSIKQGMDISLEIREEICDTIEEVGANILNPYHDLEKH
jgi:hypothetical protein